MISPVKRRKNAVHPPLDGDTVSSIRDDTTAHRHASLSADGKLITKKRHFIILFIVMITGITTLSRGKDMVRNASVESFSSIHKNSPLVGRYTLDGKYDYWSTHSEVKDKNTPCGMIHFPSIDLTTEIVEDATNTQLRNRLLLANNISTTSLLNDIVPTWNGVEYTTSHALLTLKGYKGTTPNQDRSMIAEFYVGNNTTTTEPNGLTENEQMIVNPALLMGIFDGHGERGHEVSQHVALEFPRIFVRNMKKRQHQLNQSFGTSSAFNLLSNTNYDTSIKEIMTTTFLEIDNTEPLKGSGTSGGSTASTFFYPGQGSKLYLANVGDSTVIIARYDKSSKHSTVVKQNRRDKPHLEEERKRIEAAGGQVYIPFARPSSNESGPKDSSRLLITLPDRSQLGLAMSRSIGDAEGKAFGLIAEPTVSVFDVRQWYGEEKYSQRQIEDSEWFVIIASDGVYDVLSQEEVVQRLGESLYGEGLTIERTCEQLIREASRLWIKATLLQPYRDDITLGVSRIQLRF